MTHALLLLAAERDGRLKLPERYQDAVEAAMETLAFWAGEAPDLKRAKEVLEQILGSTNISYKTMIS